MSQRLEIAVIFIFVLAILWEFFEILIHVKEKLSNKMADVVLPLVGVFLFHNFIAVAQQELVFGIAVAVFVILEFVGAYYYFRHEQGM